MSLRDSIRQADDLRREKVDVPGWPEPVYIKSMSAKQRHVWEQVLETKKEENLRLYLVVNFCFDESGNRIFQDGDESWLAEKNASSVDMLARKILTLSSATAKSLEDAAGKSTPSPG